MPCPSEETLADLVRGKLSRHEAELIDDHLTECKSCVDSIAVALRRESRETTVWRQSFVLADTEASGPRRIDATNEANELKPGTKLGRYEIVGLLGKGAMGIVYAAHDSQLDRKIALKLLREPDADSDLETRLKREAQAMARLSHPNVLTVHDVGSVDGQIFIAMELVEGSTLTHWLKVPNRRWREIRDIFLQAGKGLAAAHAADLIHRDFKPDNVLIDSDGRVFVTDFGLARAVDTDDSATAEETAVEKEALLETPLTNTGAVMGTPAYMAPELLKGVKASALSDQFSFCASMFEGLYGRRPFDDRRLGRLLSGEVSSIRQIPRGIKTPKWLEQMVLKGLSPDVKDRYPSMEALLEDLSRDPGARIKLGVAVAITLLVVGGLISIGLRERGPKCMGFDQEAERFWGGSQQAAVQSAFLATEKPYAVAAVERVTATIDAYASSWAGMRRVACEATWIHGTQSSELLDRRMACLDEARREVNALIEVFAKADAPVVQRAPRAVRGLAPLERCADVVRLRSKIEPPTWGQKREVAELTERLASASALRLAGRYSDGLAQAEPVVKEAKETYYAPLIARAQLLAGQLQLDASEPKKAETTLEEAVLSAEAAGLDEIKARALITLVDVVGYELARAEEGKRLGKRARSVLDRIRVPEVLEAELLSRLGKVAYGIGAYQEAEEQHGKALEIRERLFGQDHPGVADSMKALAIALDSQGKSDEAIALYQQTLEIRQRALGPRHPDVADSLNVLAIAHEDRGDYDKALALYQRALRIREVALGDEHTRVAHVYTNLGRLFMVLGKHKESEVAFKKSLAIQEKALGPNNRAVSWPVSGLGTLMTKLGRLDEARPYLDRSLAIRSDRLEHPVYAMALSDLGDWFIAKGDLEIALGLYERAIAIEQEKLDASHLHIALRLTRLGETYHALGRDEEAVVALQKAIAVQVKKRAAPIDLARARFGLAKALWSIGGEEAQSSRAVAKMAKETYAKAGAFTIQQQAEVDAWLVSPNAATSTAASTTSPQNARLPQPDAAPSFDAGILDSGSR